MKAYLQKKMQQTINPDKRSAATKPLLLFLLLFWASAGIQAATPLSWTTAPGNSFQLSWTATGAAEYQLEWVHVNNYGGTDLSYDFRRNSTRISTTETTYNISNLFEQGTVLFRIRSIFRDSEGRMLAGAWSNDNDGGERKVSQFDGLKIPISTPHTADSLNWQYTSNYAEGGKKKELVSYYDGSMRSHQQVTRINADTAAVVGETFYDHQGRAALQSLPVPAGNSTLAFYKNFNQAGSGNTVKAYGREHFDQSPEDNPCGLAADSMLSASGAARYYSSHNPDKNNGFNRFIPDAGGYPFWVVFHLSLFFVSF
ncbi:MAG: DUF6443 domain-containing protein [Prevotellaceae bacterium]|jgi:hypothetical protein|nr:DUF6443 domain-containing protein [Prevotellaceae bacterium]